MAKKRTSATAIRQKETFGGVNIDHFSPALPEGTPKATGMTLSFEDALKLYLSLGQILGKPGSYDRSTAVFAR